MGGKTQRIKIKQDMKEDRCFYGWGTGLRTLRHTPSLNS